MKIYKANLQKKGGKTEHSYQTLNRQTEILDVDSSKWCLLMVLQCNW